MARSPVRRVSVHLHDQWVLPQQRQKSALAMLRVPKGMQKSPSSEDTLALKISMKSPPGNVHRTFSAEGVDVCHQPGRAVSFCVLLGVHVGLSWCGASQGDWEMLRRGAYAPVFVLRLRGWLCLWCISKRLECILKENLCAFLFARSQVMQVTGVETVARKDHFAMPPQQPSPATSYVGVVRAFVALCRLVFFAAPDSCGTVRPARPAPHSRD